MRIRLLPIVLVLVGLVLLLELMVGLAHAQTVPPTTPSTSYNEASIPATQALTEAERCSVDSLMQRATIVALRGDIAKLQARVAELEAPLLEQMVTKERATLEKKFRERLKPADNAIFDWKTLTFAAAPPEKKQ